MMGKDGILYLLNFSIPKNNPQKTITDVVMFNGDFNVHIGGDLLKIQYPKLTFRRRV